MNVDDILNESDESSTPEEEGVDENEDDVDDQSNEALKSAERAAINRDNASPSKTDPQMAEFPTPSYAPKSQATAEEDFPVQQSAGHGEGNECHVKDTLSDINSQEDAHAEERKEAMGLRRNLRQASSTFVTKPAAPLAAVSAQDDSTRHLRMHDDSYESGSKEARPVTIRADM